MIAAARAIKANVDDVLLRAHVHDSGEARVAATLCLTIAEEYAAALELVASGFSSHAPIIVRSKLEALANLLNLVNDSAYVNQLRFEDARNDAILLSEYAVDPGMQEDEDARANLARWKAEAEQIRDELAQSGFRKLDVIEKFKRAGILQTYVGYRVFCSFAHSQLTTLLARHAGDFELRYHFEAPAESTASLLTVAVIVLCHAVMTVAHYTDVEERIVRLLADDADARWSAAKAGV